MAAAPEGGRPACPDIYDAGDAGWTVEAGGAGRDEAPGDDRLHPPYARHPGPGRPPQHGGDPSPGSSGVRDAGANVYDEPYGC